MSVIISRPCKEDLDEIHKLLSIVLQDTYRKEGIDVSHADELKAELGNQMNTVKRCLDTNGLAEYFLVARNEKHIIGTSAYGNPNDIITGNYTGDLRNTPEIKSVYVHPEFQGRGIGTLLFNAILISLHQKFVDGFCLDSGYKQAQKFWTKRLGKPAFILENYWGKEAHHLIWHCGLKDLPVVYTTR